MSKRITIILDDDLVQKLTNIQAKMIIKSNEATSFSKVVNYQLRKGIK